MAHSNAVSLSAKPGKPRPDFPLYAHNSGRWAKKIRGQTHYFGSWRDDPKGKAAIALWLDQKEDLLAGRKARVNRDTLTVHQLCNLFMQAEQEKLDCGDIVARSFRERLESCKIVLDSFGKRRQVDDLTPLTSSRFGRCLQAAMALLVSGTKLAVSARSSTLPMSLS